MKYNDITQHAYLALLSQDFSKFPLVLANFKHHGFYIISYQKYAKIANVTVEQLTSNFRLRDGYYIPSIHGKKLILYNNAISKSRRNFTIAHELGHAFLSHTKSDENEECEANFFASQLLIPDAAILYLTKSGVVINKQLLQDCFGVSCTTAQIKMSYIKQHISKSKLDADICSRFAPYMRNKSSRLFSLDKINDDMLLNYENEFIRG